MADHPHELVPRRERLIGALALGQQPDVGLLALQVKQGSQRTLPLLPLVAQLSVGRRALSAQGLVLSSPLPGDARHRRGRPALRQPRIGVVASLLQDLVSPLPGLVDRGIRIRFDRGLLLGVLAIRLLPLQRQAFVRVVTIGLRFLVPVRHRGGVANAWRFSG
jgi:hypothetical protein